MQARQELSNRDDLALQSCIAVAVESARLKSQEGLTQLSYHCKLDIRSTIAAVVLHRLGASCPFKVSSPFVARLALCRSFSPFLRRVALSGPT